METTEKRLFLLDAYALIYRAFFAMSKNPRLNSKGVNTSAVMGFLNSLYLILYDSSKASTFLSMARRATRPMMSSAP